MMDDSSLQLIQKTDSQFVMVELKPLPVKKNFNCDKKRKPHPKGCQCTLCNPVFSQPSLTLVARPDVLRIPVGKTYTRVPKREMAPALAQTKKAKICPTIDVPVNIKSEPELNIVDEDQTSEVTEENVAERLLLTGKCVESGKKRIKNVKKVRKVRKPTILNSNPELKTSTIPFSPLLLELTKKNIKCNICNMNFPKSNDQVKTLRCHFLQHKTSVVKFVHGITLQTNDLDEKMVNQNKPSRKAPIILNKLLANKSVPQVGSIPSGHPFPIRLGIPKAAEIFKAQNQKMSEPKIWVQDSKAGSSQKWKLFEKKGESSSPSTLPRILRKSFNIKPMPRELLERVRLSSSQSELESEKSHVIIGSTLIKPIKLQGPEPKKASEERRDAAVASDEDDDVEIVEQPPELIVIDDNDEIDKPQ